MIFFCKIKILKFQDGSKSNVKQNHVSFPEFAQNGSAKQFANGTNTNLSDKNIESSSHSKINKNETNESFDSNKESNSKKNNNKHSKRKHSHSLSKYRRLELGKVRKCFYHRILT